MYGVSSKGRVLSDYVILSNIVATILVVAVTIQVILLVNFLFFLTVFTLLFN